MLEISSKHIFLFHSYDVQQQLVINDILQLLKYITLFSNTIWLLRGIKPPPKLLSLNILCSYDVYQQFATYFSITAFSIIKVIYSYDKMSPRGLMRHLRYGSSSYSHLTVINRLIESITRFTLVYMNKHFRLPVYIECIATAYKIKQVFL